MFEFSTIEKSDPEIAKAITLEMQRQENSIELIASENFVSEAVMAAMGSPLTNKYAEGYPGKRYYGGCEYVDIAEDLARDRLKEIFKCDHANVQPHSGANANIAVFFSVLTPGDKVMGMNLDHGGHLTHGSPVNMSGKHYKIIPYGVDAETNLIDYDQVEKLAKEHKPKLIIAGGSAYSRIIDFKRFADIAKSIDAYLMVDMAHFAGLVAAGLHPNPCEYADFVTSTTHKTLRGPRGGIILCKAAHAKKIDSAVFPGIQGGPLMHVIASKAVAFKEALQPSFVTYQSQVLKNAVALAEGLQAHGFDIISGGTDTHLVLVDLRNKNFTGKDAEAILDEVDITCNKNTIPFDPKSPFVTSGIRLGSPAMTTRGLVEEDMKEIATLISLAIDDIDANRENIKKRVKAITEKYPLFKK